MLCCGLHTCTASTTQHNMCRQQATCMLAETPTSTLGCYAAVLLEVGSYNSLHQTSPSRHMDIPYSRTACTARTPQPQLPPLAVSLLSTLACLHPTLRHTPTTKLRLSAGTSQVSVWSSCPHPSSPDSVLAACAVPHEHPRPAVVLLGQVPGQQQQLCSILIQGGQAPTLKHAANESFRS